MAAELLGVQIADVLDWVAAGKLQTYGGKERNPFLRTTQVEELARELGRELGQPAAKRRQADNPVRRVELRIRADARWADIADSDFEAWVREQDTHALSAARHVAETARDRIGRLIELLDRQRG